VLIAQLASGRTLELGAGTGKNFPQYRQAATVFGLDLSWAMLARARHRQASPEQGAAVGDVAHLPMRDASLDTVTATFVCCIQPDPRPALAEITRVLRPGGQALFLEMALPRRGRLRTLLRLLEPPLRPLYGIHWQHDLPVLLVEAGLRVLEARPMVRPVVEPSFAAKPPAR
jgi:ubiquinone/menaquinone biosynthesis C-methylase UbiE